MIRDVDHVHDSDCGHGGNMRIMMMMMMMLMTVMMIKMIMLKT